MLSLFASSSGFVLTPAARPPPAIQQPSARMMFGGGGKEEGGGFMDKIKQAQEMFNPEMMKKYSEVGMKVQEMQTELAATEVECATKDGGVVVKVSGTQVPMSVTVSEELVASGASTVSSELTAALKSAHAKSGAYAQERMAKLYDDMGLSAGMAGLGDAPKA